MFLGETKMPRILMLLLLFISSTYILKADLAELPENAESIKVPLGLPPIPWPKIILILKKKPNFDGYSISKNDFLQMGLYHALLVVLQKKNFADHEITSSGIYAYKGSHNLQSVINSAYHSFYFGLLNESR